MAAPGTGTEPDLKAIDEGDEGDEEESPSQKAEAAEAIAEFEDARTAVTEERQLSSEKIRAIKLREKVREALDELGSAPSDEEE